MGAVAEMRAPSQVSLEACGEQDEARKTEEKRITAEIVFDAG